MGKIIKVYENGGSDKLLFEEIDVPIPKNDEVVIRQSYSGLNLIDTYQRSGLYPLPLPSVLGSEGAGKIYSVGKNVEGLKPGDSVTYILSIGSYSEYKVIAADKVVKLPKEVSEKQAAGMMLKGCTVQYLMKNCQKQ